MSLQSSVKEQTRIRQALLANGYTPLANVHKTCVLKGWPGLHVDAALIEEWSGQMRYRATGVRVDGRLVVVDFDIDDDAVLDALWGLLPGDVADMLDRAPIRFGGGVKMAVFLRLAEGESVFGRMVSQAYSPPGEDGTQRVEVFGSGSPRQFGVYGPRSHDDEGGVATRYVWAGDRGLVEVALDALPEVTVEALKAICDAGSRAMSGAGWTYEVRTKGGVVDGRPVYDLVEDMVFDTLEHGDGLALSDLEAVCDGVGDGVRLSASWLEGPGAVNRSRCLARINTVDGRLQIWESADCALHRPADLDLGGKVRALGERLGGVGSSDGDGGAGSGGTSHWERLQAQVAAGRTMFDTLSAEEEAAEEDEQAAAAAARAEMVERMVDMFAYWSDGSGYVVEIGQGPETAMTVTSFKNRLLPLSWEEKKSSRANAKTERVNPADLWMCHPDRREVGGFRFLPMSRDRLVQIGGKDYLNIWERPAWWDDTGVAGDVGAVEVFRQFLEHLVPNERERAWFLDWLAAKVQKPWLPNCGVVMVAEPQGTGRGTLFDILKGVFGGRHVKNVAAVQLIGGGSQSQYTDWLESSLLITCDEVLAGDDTAGTMAWKRREVYERLKALIDPRPRSMQIVRKGLPNYETDVYASFLLATNNANALPLSQDDRRIAVISNTNTMLLDRPGIVEALRPWRTDVGFSDSMSAALYHWLQAREVPWESVRESPRWMVGRERMLAANEGDLEGVLENVLAEIPGDFILANHLRDRLTLALQANGLEGEIRGWWGKTQDILGRLNRMGWRKMSARQRYQPARAGSASAYVFYRHEAGVLERWEHAALADRVDLWKPGSDINSKASRLGNTLRERGLSVVENTPNKR